MRLASHPSTTQIRRGGRGFVLAAALSAVLAQAAPPPSDIAITPEQRFQLALEAQTAREYGPMLVLLRQAARDGEAVAQETLAWVLLAGPTLYGAAVKADRCEAIHWLRQAAAKGSETARSQQTFLNRLRNAPSGKAACESKVKG